MIVMERNYKLIRENYETADHECPDCGAQLNQYALSTHNDFHHTIDLMSAEIRRALGDF
jgi:hypothetical protein